jgi:uncharacterized membrane protein HdeD (DUF308 family)
MSTGLARNWWAVGVRGIGAIAFGVGIAALPPQALASIVLAYSAYLAGDGIFAIVSGVRAMQRGDRWTVLILQGAGNLAVAGAVLAIPDLAVIPFLQITSAWAALTGALLLVAARRLVAGYGSWLLLFSGSFAIAWGVFAAAAQSAADSDAASAGMWLAGYTLPIGVALLVLSWTLHSRHFAKSV